MKILQTIYAFHNTEGNATCGLYHIELDSGNRCYLLQNGKSVGTIAHYLGKPASECISIIRDDVKQKFFELLKSEGRYRYND